jgi:hypothetical protein
LKKDGTMEANEKDGDQVRKTTSAASGAHIDEGIREKIKYYSLHKRRIESRIRELEKEWDMERVLELNAAFLALSGTLLGAYVNKYWLLLPCAVTVFLIQHSVQGWCPPASLLRFLGVRTRQEIDKEKYGLKVVRGDFQGKNTPDRIWNRLQ